MTAENRRILIIDDERPISAHAGSLLGRHGYQPKRPPPPPMVCEPLKRKVPRSSCSICSCRMRTAWKCWTDQARASRNPGDHPDRARFAEQRHRVDQARRLSFHQQTVRAGGIAQPDRESARETIAPSRNGRASRRKRNNWRSVSKSRRRDWLPCSRARRCRRSRS